MIENNELWDAYCAEVPAKRRSPQGAMAFAFDKLAGVPAQRAPTESAPVLIASQNNAESDPSVMSGRAGADTCRKALEPFADIARGEVFIARGEVFADFAGKEAVFMLYKPNGSRFALINASAFSDALATLTSTERAPQALAATPALADDDLVSRLEDHGLFNKAERNALFKEAKDEIVRLRAAATPAIGGEREALSNIIRDAYFHSPHGDWEAVADAVRAAQPVSPLRGREPIANAIREYCRSLTPAAVQNSHGVERIYYAGLSVYGLTDAILSASPPEQPAGDLDKER